MKTLEEIKKGLECCFPSEDPDCFECPYRDMENCFSARINDILAYIQRLERERDAAVEQLKEVDRIDLFSCSHCKHDELCDPDLGACADCDKNCPCSKCSHMSNWQWRGVQEVE